jgi:hypothetical protein
VKRGDANDSHARPAATARPFISRWTERSSFFLRPGNPRPLMQGPLSAPGALDVIRKEALFFCRTSAGVRLYGSSKNLKDLKDVRCDPASCQMCCFDKMYYSINRPAPGNCHSHLK